MHLMIFKIRTIRSLFYHLAKAAEGMICGPQGFRKRHSGGDDVFLQAYMELSPALSLRRARHEARSLLKTWDLSKIEG